MTAQTTSGTVLDTARPFSGFGGGVYAVYTVCGSVDFTVTHTGGGPNASVSGVFFGTPTSPPATTNYLVDTAGGLSQVVAEADGSGSLTAHYVRAGDQLLAVMRPGGAGGMWTTHFVHADGLGSVRAITDETGAVVDTRGYEAFGTKNVEAGTEALAYGFAGEAFDSTTHLAYHRARWMDARVGKFTSADTHFGRLHEPRTQHLYEYANIDPVDRGDPSGNDFDMASTSAAVSVSAIESLAASVVIMALATQAVCDIGQSIPGVSINISRCPSTEYFNHYADTVEYNLVNRFDQIFPPSGIVYLTKTTYLSAGNAQDSLALPREPAGFWRIPSSNITFLTYVGIVQPATDENGVWHPGGGNEWIAFPPIPTTGTVWTYIGP